MKGLDLSIRVLIIVALVLFVVAGVLNSADSLSGLHKTYADVILYACLLAIYTTLHDTSKIAKEGLKELTAFYIFKKRISYKLKHALKYTAWFFGGVIIFGVNSEVEIFDFKIVYYLHLLFTALAIISSYIIILLYPETKKQRNISYFMTAFGLVSFGLGFFFNLYSVTWAEFLVSLPIARQIYIIIRK